MNLIAYSDSEESDNDTPQVAKPTPKPASKPFQKVVDRSNHGKIKLNLPSVSRGYAQKDDLEAEAPPAKKARTGGGAFGGFNSMLPAPKKPKIDATTVTSAPPGSRGFGKKLGVGVNLKTGAEPAFARRPVVEDDYDEDGNPIQKETQATAQTDNTPKQKEDFRALLNLPPPKPGIKAAISPEPVNARSITPTGTEAKPVCKPKFMPMSVARGKKKKPVVHKSVSSSADPVKPATPTLSSTNTHAPAPKPVAKPKVSLFGEPEDETSKSDTNPSSGQYQPLLYGFDEEAEEDASVPDNAFDQSYTAPGIQTNPPPNSVGTAPGPRGLTNIASELNLTEAEKRQLFGRKGRGPDFSAANIIDFNTDREYAHNEMLRQQGETVQHNVVKSITGTGKNSLRSLINVATTQKDALEDHIATGKRNKREAGNKYGW